MDPERRGRGSKRNPTACEHCRASRIRCQPSEQPGVCKRCLASKWECISRTKPRPRRWESTWGKGNSGPLPQSLGHLGTFSINYSVPVKADLNDDFETLKDMHEQFLDAILIEEDPVDGSQGTSQSPSLPSPRSSSNQPHTISNIWRQPLFDVASAESLLNTFRSMANYLPFVTLPDDANIPYLATTKPFTLLSILTVASGSRMVQKHALYDDEFRKALGLKYVSGGERSLELLQGLLIYCAWYPFHLRPKSGELVHCIRMATDLVHDLHLDEDFLTTTDPLSRKVTDDELDKIRAYLAYVYLVSTYIVIWKGERCLPTSWPPWTSAAIDTLQHNARVDGDNTIVALVRMSNLFYDASKALHDKESQAVQNSRMNLAGLEQQYHEFQDSMNFPTMKSEAIRLQTMFVDVFLDCGSLVALPVSKTSTQTTCSPPPISNIYSATRKMRAFLDYVGELEDSSLLSFTINDWTRLIVVLVLSFRLSFPLSICPDFDSAWARSELQLDDFLSKISHCADGTSSNNILSASRAVLGVVKSKYDLRLHSLSGPPSTAQASRIFGCPMMGRNLTTTVEQCTQNFTNLSGSSTEADEPKNLPLFHDVWATFTMGWANASDMALDLFQENF